MPLGTTPLFLAPSRRRRGASASTPLLATTSVALAPLLFFSFLFVFFLLVFVLIFFVRFFCVLGFVLIFFFFFVFILFSFFIFFLLFLLFFLFLFASGYGRIAITITSTTFLLPLLRLVLRLHRGFLFLRLLSRLFLIIPIIAWRRRFVILGGARFLLLSILRLLR